MGALNSWWAGLAPLTQYFYIGAVFFSVLFLWQLIMSLIGLSADHDVDTGGHDSGVHHAPEDADQTMLAFKLLSVRSLLAFFTLFAWAGALYMSHGKSTPGAMLYALGWGLAGLVAVTLLIHGLSRLTETGNINIESCVGVPGTVYLDIPEKGQGEVRLLCGGVMMCLRAQAAGGAALKAGTAVRAVRVVGSNTIEVEPEEKKS
ncbi:MAG: hypothetical protein NTV79_11550 [Candidatus Aureabacteria bacterium]|nr:hypothetical protein [Candidatus Auribacterota bacterium]